jgi:hypothetical protein
MLPVWKAAIKKVDDWGQHNNADSELVPAIKSRFKKNYHTAMAGESQSEAAAAAALWHALGFAGVPTK